MLKRHRLRYTIVFWTGYCPFRLDKGTWLTVVGVMEFKVVTLWADQL